MGNDGLKVGLFFENLYFWDKFRQSYKHKVSRVWNCTNEDKSLELNKWGHFPLYFRVI